MTMGGLKVTVMSRAGVGPRLVMMKSMEESLSTAGRNSAAIIGWDRALLSRAAEMSAMIATSAATTPATAPIALPYSLIQVQASSTLIRVMR